MYKSGHSGHSLVESLEARWLFASLGRLLEYDFNSSSPWSLLSTIASNGVAASSSWGTAGTIDVEGGTTQTGAVGLTVSSAPANGFWSAELNSGRLALTNSETNLAKLTLGFMLSASRGRPVKVTIDSFNSTGQRTGGLETEILPAAADSYQRFSIDLSKMKSFGSGTFNPAAPSVSFGFQVNSQSGWLNTDPISLKVDNLNFSKPAYYVKPASSGGSNSANGRTEATAFATPQKALDVSQPGDIILLMEGASTLAYDYTASFGVMNFNFGGTPAAWISVKNYPGHSPKIYNEYWNAVKVGLGTSTVPSTAAATAYVEVRGLHIRGNADTANTTYPELIGAVDPRTNGNGISIDGRFNVNRPHHIRFADNFVEYCSGGGIGGQDTDWVQIENNVVQNNCWWMRYAGSGISVFSAYNFDGITTSVTRLVRNNYASGNECFVRWAQTNDFSDGNGIIIDVNHNTSTMPSAVARGRTLVQNNVTFDNGGSGIHTYKADHVDIINNVAYMNSASPELEYGQIFANQSIDNRIYNNILVAPIPTAGQPAEPINGGTSPSGTNGIVYRNNIFYGGNIAPHSANINGNQYITAPGVNPLFVLPSIDPAVADFRLQPTSPAINNGFSDVLVPPLDYLNNVRNGLPDIGAYEYYASSPTIVSAASATPSPVTANTTTLTVVAGDNNDPSGLTYTWSTTAKPSGAADPTFSVNGTNGAKTTVATFTKAGTYNFLVTITDAGSLSVTSAVSVVVNQTAATIAVAPGGMQVLGGSTQQYTATGTDQFGQPITSPSVTWSVTGGGSINASGLLTASQAGGSFTVTATSTNSAANGSTAFSVFPTVYTGTAGSDTFAVRLSALGSQIQVLINNIVTFSAPQALPTSLTFNLGNSSGSLTVDGSFGNPIPTGGITVTGGTGIDAVSIVGTSSADTLSTNGSSMTFNSRTISYGGLESIAFNGGAGADTLTQSAQPSNGATLALTGATSSDSLNVTGGTYAYPIPASGTGVIPITLASLSIGSGAKVSLGTAASNADQYVLVVSSLSIAGSLNNWTGQLELGANDLVVDYTGNSSAYAVVLNQMLSGLTLLGGDGLHGITSAEVDAQAISGTVLAVVDDGDPNIGGGITTISGYTIPNPATSVLVKYTWFGDANLDGLVDGSDYALTDTGFTSSGALAGWVFGDYDYNGIIDGSDYALIDTGFIAQNGVL